MTQRILVAEYTEPGYQPIPPYRPPTEEYANSLRRFIGDCADVVIIPKDKEAFWLAQRIVKPLQGWWWIGGGRIAGQTKSEAARANFRREAGLDLPERRFKLWAGFEYRWSNRQQEPQEVGCHMVGWTHSVELSEGELRQIIEKGVDPKEYDATLGLQRFDRRKILNILPACTLISSYSTTRFFLAEIRGVPLVAKATGGVFLL